jgi:hypothetical protein
VAKARHDLDQAADCLRDLDALEANRPPPGDLDAERR